LRLFLSDAVGDGGRGLFVSAVVDMDGMPEERREASEVLEPTLSRCDVVRYADCSAARICSCCRRSELGKLNHSSFSTCSWFLEARWGCAMSSGCSTLSRENFGANTDRLTRLCKLWLPEVYRDVSRWALGSISGSKVAFDSMPKSIEVGAILPERHDGQARESCEL
jgi:hypothetical protein